jgi:hypothetical protein
MIGTMLVRKLAELRYHKNSLIAIIHLTSLPLIYLQFRQREIFSYWKGASGGVEAFALDMVPGMGNGPEEVLCAEAIQLQLKASGLEMVALERIALYV